VNIGSLCTGYGGLDMALDGNTVWVSDIDKHAAKLLAHRFPTVPNLGDLTAVDWESVEPVDILTAGYPCQPFSQAGKREGQNDERHIWPHIANAIRVLRPGRVFLENVAGHLSLGFGDVLGDLAEIGYDAQWTSFRASDVGAPHRRERVFILAVRHPGHDAGGSKYGEQSNKPREASGSVQSTENIATNAERDSSQRWGNPGDVARTPRTGEADREQWQRYGDTVSDSSTTPPDSNGINGINGKESRNARPGTGNVGRLQSCADHRTNWGDYFPAVERWERTIGRPAPSPTMDSGNRPVLNPAFVEWMMGLPAGWVTDVPGISRTGQLHLLGNGVVPLQASGALAALAAA